MLEKMKIKHILYTSLLSLSFISCSKDTLQEINVDPNRPSNVPTPSLFLSAERQVVNALRSESIHFRGAQLFAQYFSQNIYTDQSRYLVSAGYSDEYWTNTYKALSNLNEIILLNEDEETKIQAQANGAGANSTQIAIARILKSFAFHSLTDVFGDIPYESYGNKDPDFEALKRNPDVLTPKYASQEKVYKDILNELKIAADTLAKYKSGVTFGTSDIVYQGKNEKWFKFANSLRLRLANRILTKDKALATQHIEDALKRGVFTSNADNAGFTYSSASPYEAPLFRATVTANRKDFAVSHVLIDVLKGDRGPFKIEDPRLSKYAKPNSKNIYKGQPYGLPLAAGNLFPLDSISLPGDLVNRANAFEVLQEYSEVEFLISEYKGWEQASYENGVKASLERWGASPAEVTAYLTKVPKANKENVLSQKYLALYGQGIESWTEIRRTGYPLFLVKKGELVWSGTVEGKPVSYSFVPEIGDSIPSRLVYPLKEQSTNKTNYQSALSNQGDDVQFTKIWWNK